ncbi:uncharacterized protein TNCV_3259431 [Trichonephila clavipes]|nr:uncharacterized protein TNCV_3259431 [Trichonephila clavipes]
MKLLDTVLGIGGSADFFVSIKEKECEETQDSDFSLRSGTSYEEIPTYGTNDSSYALIQLYSTITTAPSKLLDFFNMTSNKTEVIPDELKSCPLETIEQRYPTNEWLHIYTDNSYLPKTNATYYDGEHLAVYNAITSCWPPPTTITPATVVFIDTQAEILALSSITPNDCLN